MNSITKIITLLIIFSSFITSPTQIYSDNPLIHTYSIVAVDSLTGQIGAAVQSHWFSVGPVVPWAKAGVGAVATQSLVDITYGPLALELLQATVEDNPGSVKTLLALAQVHASLGQDEAAGLGIASPQRQQ